MLREAAGDIIRVSLTILLYFCTSDLIGLFLRISKSINLNDYINT